MTKFKKPFHMKNATAVGKKRNIGIAVRLTAISVGMLFLLGAIIISFSAINMGKNIKGREKASLRETAYTIKNAFYVLVNGDFNKLYSDDTSESEVNATSSATAVTADGVSAATMEQLDISTLMDTIHEETGIDMSVFWGDTRIATSFNNDAEAGILGAKLEDKVKSAVIDQSGEYFAENLVMEGHPHYAYYIPIINQSEVLGAIGVAKDREVVDHIISKTILNLLVFELFITAVAVVALSLMLRRISNFIKQASVNLQVIAEGDLTFEVNEKLLKRRDEIGQLGVSTLMLRDEIKDIMKDIRNSAVILSNAADDLDQGTRKTRLTVNDVVRAMEDISKGAMSQAEDTQNANYSIIEVGNQMNHITEAVNILKSRAEDIRKASQKADIIADKLEKSANNTIGAIDKIANQTDATNAAAEEIKHALDVISDIATKTNLLSLNASIEAARAGENGKGFGVVAGEIKTLAEQSSKAAHEIEDIISNLLEESEKSLEVVGSVKEIIKDQKSKLDDTRRQFEVVRDGVEESGNSIENIYEKIVVLDKQRDALVETIESLSAISEENAASTEETTASTEVLNDTVGIIAEKASELRNMSEVLKQSIQIFKINE